MTTTMNRQDALMLEAALDLAKRGFAVEPMSRSKVPPTSAGYKDATTDLGTIKDRWTYDYRGYNIGIACGKKHGIIVLDVDRHDPTKDGIASLDYLQLQYGPLPVTLTALSGGGGIHYYFKYPIGADIRNCDVPGFPGLEIKSDGGVCAPPSSHRSGKEYAWATPPGTPVAEMPDWLRFLIETPLSLPDIIVGDQLRDIRQNALDALMLREGNVPTLFLQQGAIKRIGRDERFRPIIQDIAEAEMRNALTDSANYYRMKEKDGARIPISVSPPKDVVQSILGLEPSRLPFPGIDAIVQVPTLRQDGTILDTSGYDVKTMLYYMPQRGLHIPAIPERPTQDNARQAIEFVKGFIQDFPFESQADHANTLGLLLSTVTRQMFKHVPLALIDAVKQGTGKGLLTDIVNTVATGKNASALSPCGSDEELDKRITALLMEGTTMIVMDNVEGVLRSPVLAKIITSEYHKGRVLGVSKMVDVAQRALWIANGNNVQIGGDMARRSYRIRMVTQVSNPDAREDFKYPHLDEEVTKQRGAIIAALLTIARAWFVADCPEPEKKLRKLATFTKWSDVIGGMLAYAGVEGFLENIEVLRKESDVDGNAWILFLETWQEKLGSGEYKSAEIIERLNGDKAFADTLPEPLGTMYAKEDKSLSRKLGRILAKQNGTPYGLNNLRIVKGEDSHTKVATFQVAGYAGYAVFHSASSLAENQIEANEIAYGEEDKEACKNHMGEDENVTPQIPHTPHSGSDMVSGGSGPKNRVNQESENPPDATLNSGPLPPLPPLLDSDNDETVVQVGENLRHFASSSETPSQEMCRIHPKLPAVSTHTKGGNMCQECWNKAKEYKTAIYALAKERGFPECHYGRGSIIDQGSDAWTRAISKSSDSMLALIETAIKTLKP